MDRTYVLTAFGYGLLGLLLGIYMAASKDHGQLVTHAHLLLLGFVTSFIYAVCHKLWVMKASRLLSTIQFTFHQLGTLVLTLGLFLLYGGFVAEPILGPVMGIAALVVLAGMVTMKVMVVRS